MPSTSLHSNGLMFATAASTQGPQAEMVILPQERHSTVLHTYPRTESEQRLCMYGLRGKKRNSIRLSESPEPERPQPGQFRRAIRRARRMAKEGKDESYSTVSRVESDNKTGQTTSGSDCHYLDTWRSSSVQSCHFSGDFQEANQIARTTFNSSSLDMGKSPYHMNSYTQYHFDDPLCDARAQLPCNLNPILSHQAPGLAPCARTFSQIATPLLITPLNPMAQITATAAQWPFLPHPAWPGGLWAAATNPAAPAAATPIATAWRGAGPMVPANLAAMLAAQPAPPLLRAGTSVAPELHRPVRLSCLPPPCRVTADRVRATMFVAVTTCRGAMPVGLGF